MLGLFFLQSFSFCQETISQKCCEFMQVSKVAWTPLLKENDVTFVPTGYWKKTSLHFLNGEHRPYHAQLASASPAASQLWWPAHPDFLSHKAIYSVGDLTESPTCPSATFPWCSCAGLHDFDAHWLRFEEGTEVCLEVQTVKLRTHTWQIHYGNT